MEVLKKRFLPVFLVISAAVGFLAVAYIASAEPRSPTRSPTLIQKSTLTVPSGIVKLESVNFSQGIADPASLFAPNPNGVPVAGALYNTGGNVVLAVSDLFEIRDAQGLSVFRIDPNGNIGIPNTRAGYKLNVDGSIGTPGFITKNKTCSYVTRSSPYREVSGSCSIFTEDVVAGNGAFFSTLDVDGDLSVTGSFDGGSGSVGSLVVGGGIGNIHIFVAKVQGDLDAPNNTTGPPATGSVSGTTAKYNYCEGNSLICGLSLWCRADEIDFPYCKIKGIRCCTP